MRPTLASGGLRSVPLTGASAKAGAPEHAGDAEEGHAAQRKQLPLPKDALSARQYQYLYERGTNDMLLMT